MTIVKLTKSVTIIADKMATHRNTIQAMLNIAPIKSYNLGSQNVETLF